jgi:hypothetical protein
MLLVATTKHAVASVVPLSPAPSQPSAVDWHDSLSWLGQEARVSVRPDGKYVLDSPLGERVIAAQRWRVRTASPLFDALFAMAQEDLNEDSVDAITDAAFDHGRPIRAAVSSRARSGRSSGPVTFPTPSTSACGGSIRPAHALRCSSRSRRRVRASGHPGCT